MRVNIHLTDRAKRRLGDVAVLALLIIAFLATGCGIADEDTRREATSTNDATGELTPVVHIPESRVEPVVEAKPVRTEPVSFDEAEAAYRGGRYEEAVELFTSYNESKPGNPWGTYMLGLSAWKSGDYELAELAFTEALTNDPRHVKSLLNLSRVLLETDRPEEALGEIEFALEIDSTSGDALRLKGVALHDLDRFEDAIEAYRGALIVDERDVWSMNNLGFTYLALHRYVDALPPLARAVVIAPDVALFQNNLGMALERSGYVGSAVEAYRAAVAADPSHDKARANLERVQSWGVDLDIKADLPSFAELFALEIERWTALRDVRTDTVVADTIP